MPLHLTLLNGCYTLDTSLDPRAPAYFKEVDVGASVFCKGLTCRVSSHCVNLRPGIVLFLYQDAKDGTWNISSRLFGEGISCVGIYSCVLSQSGCLYQRSLRSASMPSPNPMPATSLGTCSKSIPLTFTPPTRSVGSLAQRGVSTTCPDRCMQVKMVVV